MGKWTPDLTEESVFGGPEVTKMGVTLGFSGVGRGLKAAGCAV